MKIITLFTFLFIISVSLAQISVSLLDQNNVSAELTDQGHFFTNPADFSAGYEVPKGSGKNSIYTSAFWFGGQDVNGQIKLAAQKYIGIDQDFWPGPLTLNLAGTVNPNPLGQTIWMMTRSEIDYHLMHYMDQGYVVSNNIENWPAHGDTTIGSAYNLAPYVDVDHNDRYEPENGDYPCIRGDEAVYIIMNDRGNLHSSGGDPIGLELHYMFYQFSSVPGLEDVTFIDVHGINRSTQTVFDFKAGYFVDTDLGNYNDDYIGCDTTRNLAYTYNGDNYDANIGSVIGYDTLPPALGVVCLNYPLSRFGYTSNGESYPMQEPVNVMEYWNYMNGKWQSGTEWRDANNNPTNFMYPGNPGVFAEWSELSAGNPPGERKMIMDVDLPVLTYQGEFELSFAVMQATGSDHLQSVEELFLLTDEVQDYYDNEIADNCYVSTLALKKNEESEFSVYPNPSAGKFQIQFKSVIDEGRIIITDLTGHIVHESILTGADQVKVDGQFTPGVYFITLLLENRTVSEKIVVR